MCSDLFSDVPDGLPACQAGMLEGLESGGIVMGELLDRSYQEYILRNLATAYPHLPSLMELFGVTDNRFLVNVAYLREHGLISAKLSTMLSGERTIANVEITARGLDFLQNDGGLSAILGTVTIKFDDATIRELLVDRVQKSGAPADTKAELVKAIKSLPAEAIKKLANKAMEDGMNKIPEAFEALQNWVLT